MAVTPSKPKNRAVLLIGVVCALLAFGGVVLLLRGGSSNSPTRSVVVAKSDIVAGAVLTPDSVRVTSVPLDAAPADALTDTAAVGGKIAAGRISANTPIVPTLFQGGSPTSGTSAGAAAAAAPSGGARLAIDKGHVALAIPAAVPGTDYTTGELLSVGYYIQPGDHIDILIDPGQTSGAPAGARYSFQDVLVLRAGTATGAPAASGTAAAPAAIPTAYVVELPRAQAEALTAILTKRGPAIVVKYVLRSADEYGRPGAPNYQDSGSPATPPKQDQAVSGDVLNKLFPR